MRRNAPFPGQPSLFSLFALRVVARPSPVFTRGAAFLRSTMATNASPDWTACVNYTNAWRSTMTASTSSATRSARLGLGATPEQEAVLRRAADVAHKSLTDFSPVPAAGAAAASLEATRTVWRQRRRAVTIRCYRKASRTVRFCKEITMSTLMKAAIFIGPGRIELADKPIPDVGPNDALVRITTTTICGTDVHILKGEYPVAKGLTIGHEPVGVIEKLGSAVQGYTEGQRVIAGAICPNFNSYAAQDGAP